MRRFCGMFEKQWVSRHYSETGAKRETSSSGGVSTAIFFPISKMLKGRSSVTPIAKVTQLASVFRAAGAVRLTRTE
jgi:hypothetical protein